MVVGIYELPLPDHIQICWLLINYLQLIHLITTTYGPSTFYKTHPPGPYSLQSSQLLAYEVLLY